MTDNRRRIEIDGVQLTASVMAAVTGAILTSYLGAGGTILGTALGSGVSTAGFALYKHFLSRTKERAAQVAPVIVERARVWTPNHENPPSGPASSRTPGTTHQGHGPAAAGSGGSPGANEQRWPFATVRLPGHEDGGHGGGSRHGSVRLFRRRSRWIPLAASSAAVCVLVLAAITVVESVTGKPISTSVWGHSGSGTSIGNVVTGHGTGDGAGYATPSPSWTTTTPANGTSAAGTGQASTQSAPSATVRPTPSTAPTPSAIPSVNATPHATTPPTGGVTPIR